MNIVSLSTYDARRTRQPCVAPVPCQPRPSCRLHPANAPRGVLTTAGKPKLLPGAPPFANGKSPPPAHLLHPQAPAVSVNRQQRRTIHCIWFACPPPAVRNPPTPPKLLPRAANSPMPYGHSARREQHPRLTRTPTPPAAPSAHSKQQTHPSITASASGENFSINLAKQR